MEILAVNVIGKVERRELNGRQYLVAPLSMIVPGVLNGSKGRLLYEPSEVEKHPELWNATPITLGHPKDNHGNPISACDPATLEKYGIGWVFNDRFEKGVRRGDGWFDEILTKYKAPKTYARLMAGEKSELSTGLHTDDYPAQAGATWNGNPFSYYARNYRPDHLAVLEDQVGACSLTDGCGVNVNAFCPTGEGGGVDPSCSPGESGGGGNSKRTWAREVAKAWVDGAEASDEEIDEIMKIAAKDGSEIAKRWNDGEEVSDSEIDVVMEELAENAGRFGNPQSKNTGKFKKLGAGFGKGEVHEAAQRGALVLTDTDYEYGKKAQEELEATGHNPASWVADEDIWERAKAAADKGEYGEETYYAVVTHIYKNMGGTIKSTENVSLPLENIMPTRQQNVQHLTTNCDCWKKKGEVLQNSALFTDEEVEKLRNEFDNRKKDGVVANAVRKGVAVNGATLTVNSAGEFVVNKATTNEGTCPKCDGAMNEDGVCEECGYDPTEKTGKAAPMTNQGNQVMNQEVETQIINKLLRGFGFKSVEQMGATLNVAKQVELEKRQDLVRRIVTVNSALTQEQREAHARRLLKKSLPELEEMVALLPASTSSSPAMNEEDLSFLDHQPALNYSGAGGPPLPFVQVDNEENQKDLETFDAPAINEYDEWIKKHRVLPA